jgi:hypothetical protein
MRATALWRRAFLGTWAALFNTGIAEGRLMAPDRRHITGRPLLLAIASGTFNRILSQAAADCGCNEQHNAFAVDQLSKTKTGTLQDFLPMWASPMLSNQAVVRKEGGGHPLGASPATAG